MKILFETFLRLPKQAESDIEKLGTDVDKVSEYLTQLFQAQGSSFKALIPIMGIVARSVVEVGLNYRNDFLKFLVDFASMQGTDRVFSSANAHDKFAYLYDRWRTGDFKDFDQIKLAFGEDFITNVSLYTRSLDDFEYAFQALLLLSREDGIKKYFDHPEKVNVKELFNNHNIVSTDTIKQKIVAWSYWNDDSDNRKKKFAETVEYNIRRALELDEDDRLTDNEVAKYVLSLVDKLNLRDIDKDAFESYLDGLIEHKQLVNILQKRVSVNDSTELSVLRPFIKDFQQAWYNV